MGNLSGNLELYALLVRELLADIGELFLVPTLSKDADYICSRLSREGITVLTKVLPSFGKAFDEWLRDETVPIRIPDGIRPTFLSGLRNLIGPGSELSDHDYASVIRSIRQLCYLFYKLELPFSETQLDTAVNAFREVENEHAVQEIPWFTEEFQLARKLIGQLLDQSSFALLLEGLNPRHGPGSVASGEKGINKWRFSRVFPEIASLVDFREFYHLWPFSTLCTDRLSLSDFVIDPHPTSKMVAVPKDSRGPRLICEEPLEMQYFQQWFLQAFDLIIEGSRYAGELSMRDQSRNQVLAAEGSYTGLWATLDLKEASDRVSLPLVLSLFPDWLHPWLRALRSHRVTLPSGEVISSQKFAPMGSAICFPVETIVFWSLTRAMCVLKGHSNRLPCPTVSVFGDDIILPTPMVGQTINLLESCGLMVNRSKSYWTGSFRESCGFDAYRGANVTPVRIKKEFPVSWRDGAAVSNFVAVINGLESSCFYRASRLLYSQLIKVAPLITSQEGSFGVPAYAGPGKRRWNKHLHRVEYFSYKNAPLSLPFSEGNERMRRSLISPVSEGDPSVLSLPRLTRVEKRWLRATS